jgi:hypothetical protein
MTTATAESTTSLHAPAAPSAKSHIGLVVFGAIVALFTLPTAWLAVTSLPFFGDLGPWLDTGRALGPMSREVLSGTQWAQAGTALALWMLLPLLIGTWRITRREVAS